MLQKDPIATLDDILITLVTAASVLRGMSTANGARWRPTMKSFVTAIATMHEQL